MEKSTIIAALLGASILAGAAFAAAPTYYQTGATILSTLLGTERIAVDNGYGGNTVTQINTLRNTTGYQLSSLTTGTVVTTTATDNLILTGAATTLTVDLPPTPPDGALFSLNNGTSSNFTGTITVATTDSSTIANGATAVNLGSAGSQEWQYVAATTTWYRLR